MRRRMRICAPILLAPEDAAARNNLAQLLADAGCADEARRQVVRATRLAEGTALAPAVAETRATIESMESIFERLHARGPRLAGLTALRSSAARSRSGGTGSSGRIWP